MTKNNINKTNVNNNKNISLQPTKIKTSITSTKAKQNNEASKFKAKYFEYYDDVKTHNNGPYDW